MMRFLATLTFAAIVLVAFVVYVVALVGAFLLSSFGQFLVWLSSDGLPVTIGAALVALAVGGYLAWERHRTPERV